MFRHTFTTGKGSLIPGDAFEWTKRDAPGYRMPFRRTDGEPIVFADSESTGKRLTRTSGCNRSPSPPRQTNFTYTGTFTITTSVGTLVRNVLGTLNSALTSALPYVFDLTLTVVSGTRAFSGTTGAIPSEDSVARRPKSVSGGWGSQRFHVGDEPITSANGNMPGGGQARPGLVELSRARICR